MLSLKRESSNLHNLLLAQARIPSLKRVSPSLLNYPSIKRESPLFGDNSRKIMGETLSPSLGRVPLAQARIAHSKDGLLQNLQNEMVVGVVVVVKRVFEYMSVDVRLSLTFILLLELRCNGHVKASTSSKVDELSEVNSNESSSCSSSNNSPTYDELYSAFVELHEELKKVAKLSLDRKRVILLQEKKITNMQKEIDELKLENENLDLIYSNASCMCSSKLIETHVCETCCDLKTENNELKKKITKFTYISQNLKKLLTSSKNIGNRIGLGFKHKNNQRPTRKHVANRSNVNG
ncbi:hypothetical protein Lal_00043020 [Lupinus albus]|nr:hypothetical protein Lal_00043020 [Lupinus albus]